MVWIKYKDSYAMQLDPFGLLNNSFNKLEASNIFLNNSMWLFLPLKYALH